MTVAIIVHPEYLPDGVYMIFNRVGLKRRVAASKRGVQSVLLVEDSVYVVRRRYTRMPRPFRQIDELL